MNITCVSEYSLIGEVWTPMKIGILHGALPNDASDKQVPSISKALGVPGPIMYLPIMQENKNRGHC